MTGTMPDSMLGNAARLRLPELLGYYEHGVHLSLKLWEDLCEEALRTGDAAPLHAQRDSCESFLRGGLENIDVCLRVTEGHADPATGVLRVRLTALRDQLATKHGELFPKWQTVEDLEDILLAHITPNHEAFVELANRFPPPQSWYDETTDPFTAEESSP